MANPNRLSPKGRLSRRDFLKLSGAGLGLAGLACAGLGTPTPTAIAPIGEPIAGGELVAVKNSVLMVPQETAIQGDQAVSNYLTNLIIGGRGAISYRTVPYTIPYINNPAGGIPQNDDPTLLTGEREPGQSLEALDNQPLSGEVRLYSTGQVVLPLTDASAENLESSVTTRESRLDGTQNVHLVYTKVQLADGRPGLLIPGGKDADHNVNTPDDNYNRGNVFIILPPTEQGSTALAMQVDTRSNWLAQFKLIDIVSATGGINAADLIPYLLYDPDAQRSEGHGMSTIQSMYEGPNCQGAGCRTVDNEGKPIAGMAGVGVYIIQLEPKANGIRLLAATVLPDSEIPALIR